MRSLCLASWWLLWIPSCVHAQESAPLDSELEAIRAALEDKIQGRDENAQQIKSAFASGRVQFLVREAEETEATILLDAGLQIYSEGTKYRVHLSYDRKLEENPDYQGPLDEEHPKWIDSTISERIILFDGERLFSINFDQEGSCNGMIYFGFAKMAVMRAAGYPFEDPIRIWQQALNVEGIDVTQTKLSPFQSRGMLGIMQKNTYRMRFLFLDNFDYDLRRVSSFRVGESQPFRDYTLNWEACEGAYYVKRFSNTTTSAHGNTGSRNQTMRRLTVDFDTFKNQIEIPLDTFTIQSLSIPVGSPFFDKRASVDGSPQKLIFSGTELQPE